VQKSDVFALVSVAEIWTKIAMRLIFAVFMSLGVLAAQGRAENLERRFVQTVPAPTETVVLKVSRGVINITSGPAGSELSFDVLLRVQRKGTEENRTLLDRLTPDLLAPLKRDIDGAFARLAPRFRTDAQRVELTVRDSREVVFDADPALQMAIEVKVVVPAGLKLEVRTVAAGVVADDYKGSVDVRSDTGSCFVKSVSGDFSAETNGGSITVGEVGGRSNLRTASGNILTGRLHGPAKLVTANGGIEVQQAYDSIRIRGEDAAIILGLSDPLPKSIDLATSAGSITLNVDRNLPLTVDAATRLLGKVRARGLQPIVRRGAINQSYLLADFNGGSEAVRLRTNWGSIELVGREPLDG
jgi:hypothetical protein